MPRLLGKTALITGAARGIGAAIARAFATEGARHVYVTDLDAERGQALADELGAGATYHTLDVREDADWQRVSASLSGLDVLVNNAGITGFEAGARAHDPEHASLEDWRAVHRTNCDGVFLGCKCHRGDAAGGPRGDHKYRVAFRRGGYSCRRSLRIIEGGYSQSYEKRSALLRRAGAGDHLQRDFAGRHPDADVGADAGRA